MAAFILNMYVRGFQEIIQIGLIEEERGGGRREEVVLSLIVRGHPYSHTTAAGWYGKSSL